MNAGGFLPVKTSSLTSPACLFPPHLLRSTVVGETVTVTQQPAHSHPPKLLLAIRDFLPPIHHRPLITSMIFSFLRTRRAWEAFWGFSQVKAGKHREVLLPCPSIVEPCTVLFTGVGCSHSQFLSFSLALFHLR